MLDHKYANYVRSNNVKKCPRCHIAVEKVSGCNEMECRYEYSLALDTATINSAGDVSNTSQITISMGVISYSGVIIYNVSLTSFLVVDQLICLKIFVSSLLLLFMPLALFLNIFIM